MSSREEQLRELVLSVGTILPDHTPEKPSMVYGHPTSEQWAKIFLAALAQPKQTAAPLEPITDFNPDIREIAFDFVGDLGLPEHRSKEWLGWRTERLIKRIVNVVNKYRVAAPPAAPAAGVTWFNHTGVLPLMVRYLNGKPILSNDETEILLFALYMESKRNGGLIHDADMRAIKMWQEAHPGNDNVWPDRTKMIFWLLETLTDANEVLRSAYSIAARGGKETNWPAFTTRIEKALRKQHEVMHEPVKLDSAPPAAPAAGVTAELKLHDYATGAKGDYCIGRTRNGTSEFWNPSGWSGFGYVFTDKQLAESIITMLAAAAEKEKAHE